MSEQTPYLASYAKSGSDSCSVCKEIFAENTLQLAVRNQTDLKSDIDHWFHLNCFFTKEKPKSVEEIANFSTLLKEDQKQVRSKIDEMIALAEAELNGLKSAPEMRDFFIEYAKSTSAGFLNNCDERFRNVLRDDNEYLNDSLPQEFSDVLKRLDLKDETDDEEETKSENSSNTNEDEKCKTASEEPDKKKANLSEDQSTDANRKSSPDVDNLTQVNGSLVNDPTQHGNNFVNYQSARDNLFEFDDNESLQDFHYFADNEFEETEFDQDEIGEDEIFDSSDEDSYLDFGCGDSDHYCDTEEELESCIYEENLSEESDQDMCDYGDCATLFEEHDEICEVSSLDLEEVADHLRNGKGYGHHEEFDAELGYAPK